MGVGAKSATVWALPLALAVVAMAAIAFDPGGFASRLRWLQFDTYQVLKPRAYENPLGRSGYAVRTLDFTGTRDRLGAWPLPRAVLAHLVERLKAAGAAVVVLDAPLAAPDPLSPALFAAGLPPGADKEGLRSALKGLPSRDAELARALASVHAVTALTLIPQGKPAYRPRPAVRIEGDSAALRTLPAYGHAVLPLPLIRQASAGLGASNLPRAGRLRAMPMLFRLADTPVPSLDAEVLRLIGGGAPLTAVAQPRGIGGLERGAELVRIGVGNLTVPVRPDGALQLYLSGRQPARRLSAAALDAGTLKPGSLAHSIVYIAPPDAMAQTPLGPEPVAQLHAEAMENILLQSPLRIADSLYGGLVFLLVCAVAVAILAWRLGLLAAAGFTLAALAAAQAFTWYLFADSRVLFDSLNPSLGLVLVFAGAAGARTVEIARSRRTLIASFGGLLAPAALARLARRPAPLTIEGEARTVTCLACGIRGYAQLAQSFADDPVGFTNLTGTVLTPLVEAATAHGAMVDGLTGGGFLAYWNAPLDDGEHAIHACEAANRMTVVLAEVNEQLSRERRFDGTAYDPIEIGIGLSTGPAVAGSFRLGKRLQFGVHGECVTRAERIRAASGRYGPAIVAGEDTRKAAERGFAFLEVDYIALEAREEPVKLYAVLGNPLVRASPKFRALATFHEHIFQSLRTQQWGKARELIEQCRKLSGASPKIYDLLAARIDWYEDHPPGSEWDGAFRPAVR